MQVVEWVLGGVRTEWQSPSFQAGIDSPAAFIGHYFNLHADANGTVEVRTDWANHPAAETAADDSKVPVVVAASLRLLPGNGMAPYVPHPLQLECTPFYLMTAHTWRMVVNTWYLCVPFNCSCICTYSYIYKTT